VQYGFGREFEVESYLEHQSRAFVDRFDANSLLYLTRAIDYFDLVPPGGTLRDAFRASDAAFLFLTFSSDWLYPPYHLEEVAEAARAAGRPVGYREVPSEYGHDAFLLEHEAQEPVIRAFLAEGDRYNPWRHPSLESLPPCPSPAAAIRPGSPSASWPPSVP
jgi:homoserine O-acetyltransferase